MKKLKLSASAMKKALNNPFEFHLNKHRGIYAEMEYTDAVDKGTAWHYAMEQMSNGKDIDEAKQLMLTEYKHFSKKALDQALTMTDAYIDKYGSVPEGKAEVDFEFDFVDGAIMRGFIDVLHVDEDGYATITDYKSYSRPKGYDTMYLDIQGIVYTWAVQQMGYKFKKMIWDQVTPTGICNRIEIEYTEEYIESVINNLKAYATFLVQNPEFNLYLDNGYKNRNVKLLHELESKSSNADFLLKSKFEGKGLAK
jgi:ATP-dependent helicase/DNAse subunit B